MDETDRVRASWKPRPADQEEKGGFGLSLQLLTHLQEALLALVKPGMWPEHRLPISPWGRGWTTRLARWAGGCTNASSRPAVQGCH